MIRKALPLLVLALSVIAGCARTASLPAAHRGESENKRAVAEYMAAFAQSDHARVLACLTDDVEWDIPGMFHIAGKAAFDKEIMNDAFVGKPMITVSRMTEQAGVVVAEGAVRCEKKAGGWLDLRFCDVFELSGGKIRKLTSFLMDVKE